VNNINIIKAITKVTILCLIVTIVYFLFETIVFRRVLSLDAQLEKEVTFENGYLIYRVIPGPDSFVTMKNYELKIEKGAKGSKYLIKLIMGRSLYRQNPSIRLIEEWPGYKVSIPAKSFNPKKDRIYYKDNKGTYRIRIGTRESWKKILQRKTNKYIDDSIL
jgi:hypothetical protein